MKKNILEPLRTFSFAILAPLLSVCLIACHQDDIEEIDIPCAKENHIHAVDLGLSVKWACCNVGATSPEEYGGYYAWGETEEKNIYSSKTYKWYDFEEDEIIKYPDETSGNGFTLEPEDDVAQSLWGEGWRMPTQAEIKELMDRCTWTWTSMNGVYGYKVSGNGNYIFLPAAGSYCEEIIINCESRGCYMSSTLYNDDIELEHCIGFNKKSPYHLNDYRRNGHSVRPVKAY